ncbi:putative phosphoglycerate mutase [Herbaspirillum sp. Sphag1AN]|uniref:histidine phosphatase family protein n=1 Tax=unclassified Herbaspirillum TaxID=2624150 RepID=UPI001608CC74|nr:MULTISPECIES: histidine phosphatase family protein [unclassified Herbaspirillum]MBB3213794.1 putative phosphoglycerate mutase [Herbaspirillum sp. Sphag1AN]MBB3246991.1 putative phosphoglycerate mutase [Herbaspirillum sp. Sphag64]
MTDILLIRHGETDWNVDKRLQGHIDIALNAEGRRQAAALGAALAEETLDAVFASDLQRARDTAQAVAQQQGLTVQIVPALRERCYGGFEGLRHQEIAQPYPADYVAWKAREPDARYPAGERVAETMREFSARAVAAVMELVKQNNYRKIVIVTHGGVLECLYRWSQQSGFGKARDFDIFNASINRLRWDGSHAHIQQWGDIAHLRAETLDEVDR